MARYRSADMAPQPERLLGIEPSCHHARAGSQSDFVALADRRMHWCPSARRQGAHITGWTAEWMCHSCHRSVDLGTASP
eukprot:11420153-Karenia_brevis.AAC.1